MVHKHIKNQEYISVKTNDDLEPLNYSTKPIKNLKTIIISKKEFQRLLQDFEK